MESGSWLKMEDDGDDFGVSHKFGMLNVFALLFHQIFKKMNLNVPKTLFSEHNLFNKFIKKYIQISK